MNNNTKKEIPASDKNNISIESPSVSGSFSGVEDFIPPSISEITN